MADLKPGQPIAPGQILEQTREEFPASGDFAVTMDQVTARFGAPAKEYPAVGKPPITRWDYPSFSVFFEFNRVVHSVVHG